MSRITIMDGVLTRWKVDHMQDMLPKPANPMQDTAQEVAFRRLDDVTDVAAKETATQVLTQLVVIKASNPRFRFGLHKGELPEDAAVIVCSGCPDDTVVIGIKPDGGFGATFGQHLTPSPNHIVAGDGGNQRDIERLMQRIRAGNRPALNT